MIDRRRLLMLAALPLTPATAFEARSDARLPAVGFVGFASPEGDRQALASFRKGLAELGQREGQTIDLVAHSSNGDLELGSTMIAQLAARPVDVFLSPGPAATRAILARTSIPIVAIGLPPVAIGHGLFTSLARPGGTVTGFSTFGEELSAKRIELLRELLPGLTTLGVMHNTTDPTFSAWGDQTVADAHAQGLRTVRLGLTSRSAGEAADLVRRLRGEGGQALIVIRDFLTATLIGTITAVGLENRLAVVGEQRDYSAGGALLSYGPDIPDLFRRAAGYVVRILNGEPAGQLPIQLPTTFALSINRRVASSLGISVPPSILVRADEVIE